MKKIGVLFLFLFLFHCFALVHGGLSTEQVIEEVERVFHLVDEGTLKNQGDAALPKLQPIFQRFPMMHCPSFTAPAAWPSNDTRTLSTCLYAVLGGLVMGNVTFSEGDMQEFAQCRFLLDPQTGILVNGDAAKELGNGGQAISTTNTIMTVLVIVLLISMGLMLFIQNTASYPKA